MKISICIPQYNRIRYLLKSLEQIADQSYPDMEIVISDDASSDNTSTEIARLKESYKYPIRYHAHPVNVGYDANLRKSLELATGRYCLVLGNDDSLQFADGIAGLVSFLEQNDFPEIGFCNYVEDSDPGSIIERASASRVVGKGEAVASRIYRSFSFVGGVIIRKDTFDAVNTAALDGSIYVQIYFAARIISSGGRCFTYAVPLVRKDIRVGEERADSYRDKLIRKWSDLRPLDGGLKSMAGAVLTGFRDAGANMESATYTILKNIYRFTYPYWLIDYRGNKAFVAAIGMVKGLRPSLVPQLRELNLFRRMKIRCLYFFSTAIGLTLPVPLFRKWKQAIYRIIKK
jgi:abequosyltransferase